MTQVSTKTTGNEVSVVDFNKIRKEFHEILKKDSDNLKEFGEAFIIGDLDEEVAAKIEEGNNKLSTLKDESFSTKFKSRMANLPILKNFIDDEYKYLSSDGMRQGRIVDVTDTLFKSVQDSKDLAVRKTEAMEEIYKQSVQNYERLGVIIDSLKNVDPAELSYSERDFLSMAREQYIANESLLIEMQGTMQVADKITQNVSSWIPVIRNQLQGSLMVNNALNSVIDTDNRLKQTMQIVGEVSRENSRLMKDSFNRALDTIKTGEEAQRMKEKIEQYRLDNNALKARFREITELQIEHLRETNEILEEHEHIVFDDIDKSNHNMIENKK